MRDALQTLADTDARLRAAVPRPLSLSPERELATPLPVLGETLLPKAPALAAPLAASLSVLVDAMLEAFPENIFWDLDLVAARLVHTGDAEELRSMAAHLVKLQRGFGRHSPIRFRYVHDFLYGFDWARWVAKDPPARADSGPLDWATLRYIEGRRGELVELIARDDEKYGRLDDGELRNPFGFSREPDDERRLHEALAGEGLIPVEAWTFDGARRWDRDYTELRQSFARRLGIPTRETRGD